MIEIGSTAGADWAAWQPGTFQVGRLVRRLGGPPRQTWKEGVERRKAFSYRREGSTFINYVQEAFKYEVLVFSLISESLCCCSCLKMSSLRKSDQESWQYRVFSVISVLFMFRCLILQEGDFPAVLRTIDQTVFIEVRLLILETYVFQECRLDVLITRLVWARITLYIVYNIVM